MGYVPLGIGDEVMEERLRLGSNNTADCWQELARNVADEAQVQGGDWSDLRTSSKRLRYATSSVAGRTAVMAHVASRWEDGLI